MAAGPNGTFFRGGRGISADPAGGGAGGGAPPLGGGGGALGGGGGGSGGGGGGPFIPQGWPRLSSGPKARLNSVWAGDGGAWAVGERGAILRSSPGPSWVAVTSNTTQSLRGVWGSQADDLWAVGAGGTLLHGDGTSWSLVDAGTHLSLNAVWGSSASDVWAAGEDGCMLHWSGASWIRVDAGTNEAFSSVWGRGPNDVWAVARAVLHWDGAAWTPVATGARGSQWKISGSPNQLFILGYNAANGCHSLLHFDGVSWSYTEGSEHLSSVWARGDDEAWVAGSYVRRWNGSTLSPRVRGLGWLGWSDLTADGSDLLLVNWDAAVVRIRD